MTVGVIFDFVTAAMLLLGGLAASDAGIDLPAVLVGGGRQPPGHYEERGLRALPVEQIQQAGRGMSRLGIPLQYPGSRTVVKSEGDKLLGRGTVNWPRRARGGLSHSCRSSRDQEQGEQIEKPDLFTGAYRPCNCGVVVIVGSAWWLSPDASLRAREGL